MILKAEAFVLKTFNYRETSKIAIFYSREFGKINGLLKGIRKDFKKFITSLEPGSLNDLIFYKSRGSGLHLVGQCDLKKDFMELRSDLKKSLSAKYVLELVNSIMPSEDKNEEVFKLLNTFLKELSESSEAEKLIFIFQIKILLLSGFKPHLDSCVVCNGIIREKANFSHHLGGLICEKCSFKDRTAKPILKGTIASILHIEKSGWQYSLRLGISGTIRQELDSILSNFLSFHLEKPLKPLKLTF